jgi:hypothetical protein
MRKVGCTLCSERPPGTPHHCRPLQFISLSISCCSIQDKGLPIACMVCATQFSQERCVLPYTLKCTHMSCGDCMRRGVDFLEDTPKVTVACFVCSHVATYASLKAVPVNMEWAEKVDGLRYFARTSTSSCFLHSHSAAPSELVVSVLVTATG